MTPLRIVHAADVHLDRAFTDQGLRATASERRRSLRDAFDRILNLARERRAAAICIAGDLYEHEHVTADTEAYLIQRLAGAGCPVVLLPGNHDPYVVGSVYERADWPANVHVFSNSEPEPYELDDEAVIWGIGYTGRELRPDSLAGFRAPVDGRRHLLLLHASLTGADFPAKGDALPLTPGDIQSTGVDFAMLGHYHGGFVAGNACYPGSPEPLTWGEIGVHAANVLTVEEQRVTPELVEINQLAFDHASVDVTGCESSAELDQAMREHIAERSDPRLALRLTLTGEVGRGCEIRAAELEQQCVDGLNGLVVEDRTVPSFDLEGIAEEHTTRGRFVGKLLELAEADPSQAERARRAAYAGLRAIEGRSQLLDLSSTELGAQR